ncbi:uncharacterized protein CC84DRAFT_439258 [Paraphaeosphaeria sporulosa]|uniref:Uncharacterized protein n=1 Tax=Paraphaeosphaeria sporulosa TaxID=1460663 RepID=A0A177CPQ1_9PLEO|nr:uncharacterized protein CC84DRAFT_439258 [Paraphaeosphaeria sporulosa]OAG09505.1 hypothetical protein CC84DRAFT_439258 [Paraphaeosphaeria sporulosa]
MLGIAYTYVSSLIKEYGWQQNGHGRARTSLRKPCFQNCVYLAPTVLILLRFRRRCVSSAVLSGAAPTILPGTCMDKVTWRSGAGHACRKDHRRFGTELLRSGMLSLSRLYPPVCDPREALPSVGWSPVSANLLAGVKSSSRAMNVPTTSPKQRKANHSLTL